MDVSYRKANVLDLAAVVAFVDYWLTGGGQSDHIPGATHDYFVRKGQQEKYLRKYDVMLATFSGEIVGWAVKTDKGVLIHLLIAATFRGMGIGKEMLRRMKPETVRSKFDQKSGDPAEFYRKQGYVKVSSKRVGRNKNIELFTRADVGSEGESTSKGESGPASSAVAEGKPAICSAKLRSVDAIAKRFLLKKVGLGKL